jgi:YhcH/YjgK/YiaL family protein
MIYGNIGNLGDISIYPEAIQTAIKYLRDTDLLSIEAGIYELQGKDMYVQVSNIDTAPKEDKKPEVHRKYIDVQYLVEGKEKIGFAVDTGKNKVSEEYIEEKDVLFYEECENESELIMTPGAFVVFFPNIVHRPACKYGENLKIKKVVIKINKTLL